MAVTQQMSPAALFGTVVVVVGGVEVADQHASKPLAQDFIHHRLAPSPSQEVPLGGRAEGPHVAVVSVLPPAGLIGMHHQTASDAFHYIGHHRLGLGSPLCVVSTMAPSLRCNPGTAPRYHWMVRKGSRASSRSAAIRLHYVDPQNVDPQTLPPHHHTVQLRRWHTAVLTARAGAGDVNVLGDLHRNLNRHRNPGQVDDFPSALGPTTGQLDSAVRAVRHGVLHPLGGRHAGAGKAVATRLAGRFGLGRFPVGFGLQTGHPTRAPGFGRAFQLGNPLLQPLDDDLLPDDDGNQDIPVGSLEINFPVNAHYMT